MNAIDEVGWTPLHWASRYGYVGFVEKLLKAAAPVHAINKAGWTPLHFAAYGGHVSTVRTLLANGADINATNEWGQSPLLAAMHLTQTHQVAKELISAGADASIVDKQGETAVTIAKKNGDSDMVKLLKKARRR